MRNVLRALLLGSSAALLLGGCFSNDPTTPGCQTVQLPAISGDTVTTASGLRYVDVAVGSGAVATDTSTVSVHYIGYLANGTLFSATIGGPPDTFVLTDAIPGFREGVTGMRVGGTRRLIIPPNLAYGADSPTPCIPPNSTLLFHVELIAVGSAGAGGS